MQSVVCVSGQGAQGNLCEVSRTNLQGQKLDHHKMQTSDERYIRTVFKNLQEKLNLPEREQILDQKDPMY